MITSKTQAQWVIDNTVLADGDYGIESENGHYKVGDGSTAWNDLVYYGIMGGLISTSISQTQDSLSSKQDTLVSATNIKTINGLSVLGSGDLSVSGSGLAQYQVRQIIRR